MKAGKQGRQRKNRWQGACIVARIAQGAWGNRGSLLKAIQTHKCYAAPKAALDKVGLQGQTFVGVLQRLFRQAQLEKARSWRASEHHPLDYCDR